MISEISRLLSYYDYNGAERIMTRYMKLLHLPNDPSIKTNSYSGQTEDIEQTMFRSKFSIPSFKHQLFPRLLALLDLEKLYTSLSLSRPRRMFGRESLDEAYRLLQLESIRELAQLDLPDEFLRHPNATDSEYLTAGAFVETGLHIFKALSHFAETRAKQIHLWHALSQSNYPSEIVKLVPLVEKNLQSTDLTLIASLSPSLASMINWENRMFFSILSTELGLQNHDMINSLGHLFNAQIILSEWKSTIFPLDRPRPFLSPSLIYPVHMQFWIQSLHHYICKLTLLFHKLVFHPQKLGMDYIDTINDYIRSQKCETSFHLLYIVHPNQCSTFDSSGYKYSNSKESKKQTTLLSSGIETYQCIYSTLKELSSAELANAVAILMTHSKQGRTLELGELLPFVDDKLNKSFYLTKFDTHLLALILLNEKRPRDVNTIEFLTTLKNYFCAKQILKLIH